MLADRVYSVYAAVLLSLPTPWILVGSVVTLGASMLTAAKYTRQNDCAS
ncbi:MAG: hypothetical protein ACT4NL_07240 [Pseudomarimonas sp.]